MKIFLFRLNIQEQMRNCIGEKHWYQDKHDHRITQYFMLNALMAFEDDELSRRF